MYMAPIVRDKTPASAAARRVTGVVVVPIAGLFMLPWIAGYAFYAALVLGVRGIAKVPRLLIETADYAGAVILGQ